MNQRLIDPASRSEGEERVVLELAYPRAKSHAASSGKPGAFMLGLRTDSLRRHA
jgi:hypothetical protein